MIMYRVFSEEDKIGTKDSKHVWPRGNMKASEADYCEEEPLTKACISCEQPWNIRRKPQTRYYHIMQ